MSRRNGRFVAALGGLVLATSAVAQQQASRPEHHKGASPNPGAHGQGAGAQVPSAYEAQSLVLAREANRAASRSADASVRQADAAWWQVGLGACATLFTAVAAGAAIAAAKYAKKAADHTEAAANTAAEALKDSQASAAEQSDRFERQLTVATEAARAAELSAKAAIGVELPVLRVASVSLKWDQKSLSERLLHPRLRIVVQNYGRTPAFLSGEAVCLMTNVDLGKKPDYSTGAIDLPLSAVIEPNDRWALDAAPQHSHFTADEVDELLQIQRVLYVYGYVAYADFLRDQHMLRFIYEMIPQHIGEPRFTELKMASYSDSF